MTAKGLAFVSLPRVGALRAGWVACSRPRANCLTNVTATVDPLAVFSLSCPPGLSAARGVAVAVAVAVEGGVVVAMGGDALPATALFVRPWRGPPAVDWYRLAPVRSTRRPRRERRSGGRAGEMVSDGARTASECTRVCL